MNIKKIILSVLAVFALNSSQCDSATGNQVFTGLSIATGVITTYVATSFIKDGIHLHQEYKSKLTYQKYDTKDLRDGRDNCIAFVSVLVPASSLLLFMAYKMYSCPQFWN